MDWQTAVLGGVALGSTVFGGVAAYLWFAERARWLGVWSVAWALVAVRSALALGGELPGRRGLAPGWDAALLVGSALVFLWGQAALQQRPRPRRWALVCGLAAVWAVAATSGGRRDAWTLLPAGLVATAVSVWVGVGFIRPPRVAGLGQVLLGGAFLVKGAGVLWPLAGLLDSRPTAPWLLTAPALVELALGTAMLLYYHDRSRAELLRVRAQSEQGEPWFRRLFEESADACYLFDQHARLVGANPAAVGQLGYPLPELVGRSISELETTWTADEVERLVASLQDGPRVSHGTVQRKDGTPLRVEVHASRVELPDGFMVLAQARDLAAREAAEAAVEAANRRLRQLIDASPLGVHEWELRPDGELRFVGANCAADRILGIDHGALVGRPIEEAFPGLVGTPVPDLYRRVAASGEAAEHPLFTYESETIVGGFELLAFQTAPQRMAVLFRDVTERQRAEQASREAHDLLVKLAAQLPGMVYVFRQEPDGRYTVPFTSDAVTDIFGCTPAAVSEDAAALFASVHPADLPELIRTIEESAANLTPWHAEYRTCVPGRPERWFIGASAPERLPDGRVQWYGYSAEITAQKQLEAALRRTTEELEHYFGLGLDLFAIADTNGFFRRLNREWERTLGYRLEDLEGQRFLDFVHPDDVPATLATVARLRSQEAVVSFANRYRCADGSYRWIEWRSAPAGEVIYAAARDVTERMHRERELQETSERLQELIESSPAAILSLRPDGVVTGWNPAAERLFGWTAAEAIGQFAPHAGGVHDHQVRDFLAQVAAGQRIDRVETQRVRKDGSTVDVSLLAAPMRRTGPEVTEVLAIYIDITDRKRAEEQLRESQARMQSIFRVAPIGIGVVVDRVLREVNDRLCEMVGRPAGELVGQSARQLYPSDEAFAWVGREKYRQIAERGTGTVETKWVHADGHPIDVLLSSTPLVPDDLSAGVTFTALDITEERRAAAALRESEERFRRLIEGAPDAVFVQTEGRLAYVNHAAVALFGAARADDLLGRPMLDLIHPDERAAVAERIRQLNEERLTPPPTERCYLRLDGEQLQVEIAAVPITYGGQNGALVFVRDITERKRAEEESQRLQRQMQHTAKLESLGVLAGGIAHDFNNLLTTILGNLDLALSDLSPVAPARESLAEAEAASRRAADLARQMLAYSGKGRFVVRAVDLNEVVTEMGQMLTVSISKKAALRYHLAPSLPAVEADPSQLRQVIMNLLINASEALGDEPGAISITTGVLACDRDFLAETWLDDDLPEGQYAFLDVTDTGCGMDKETLARIFDPFFTTKFTGRGLGLAAVLGIVRGHRGALKVYSEPGQGTSFKVLFPAVSAPAEKSPAPATVAPWTGTGTVLLVDDEEAICAMGRRMLERLGFEVLTAGDGREAIEVFQSHPGVRAVILDLTMPRLDGEEAFRELRQINPDVRVILSSGYNEQEVTQRFVGQGLAGFIQKPYKLDVLAMKLREVLGG